MKKTLLCAIVSMLAVFSVTAQIVNIPDPVFKNFLVNHHYNTNPMVGGIDIYLDSNHDGEIQVSEAASYTSDIYNHAFFLQALNISDLSGIEAFQSIQWLNVPDNPLTALNITGCLSLKRLTVNYNNAFTTLTLVNPSLEILELSCPTLTSVDLSGCTGLKNINCSNSPNLTSLNISGCGILEELRANTNPQLTTLTMGYHYLLTFFQCNDDHLTAIDVSSCPSLEWMMCTGNQLTSLNLANGNPQSFEHIMATGNPDLTCIKVDNVAVSEFLWAGDYPYSFDEWASFSLDCTPAGPCVVAIPDANFKAILVGSSAINTNGNGEIECDEAITYTGTINVDNADISDMTGIEAFINLTALSCNSITNWNFTTLNVSGLTALTSLSCTGNYQFSSLNASSCTALTDFDASSWADFSLNLSGCTSLTSLDLANRHLNLLDVSNCSALTSLVCNNNSISALNVNGCNALTTLNCSHNSITSLVVNNIQPLINLDCSFNELVLLNVLDNNNLTILNCSDNHLPYLLVSNNPGLTQLNCSHNNITYLDVNNNLELINLDCSYNSLNVLNVNPNTALLYLNCGHNNLTAQNVSFNTALTTFYCDFNNLTTINVSNNVNLKYFICSYNQLPGLDLTSNAALLQLDCSHNLLTELVLTGNPLLSQVYCTNNQLTGLNLNSNPALVLLDCSNNNLAGLALWANTNLIQIACAQNMLTTLDISNTHCLLLQCNNNLLESLNLANGYNSSAITIFADNNAALSCVQVDNAAFSTENWAAPNFMFDAGVNFTEDCYALGTAEIANNSSFSVYPNPTKDVIHFSKQVDVQLYNLTGQLIANRKNINFIDLSGQSTGIYLVTFTDDNGQIIQRSKIVKE